MEYKISDEAIQRVAKRQYDLNHEAQQMSTKKETEDSKVTYINTKESRLIAVESLIASKLKHYSQETIDEAVRYGIYRFNQGDTVYRAIHKAVTLTRRLAELPGPTVA